MKTILPVLAMLLMLTSSAQVALNEVYPDPGSGNQEFLELYNTSISQTPENLDNYTLVTYYDQLGKTGFYVLDMPNLSVSARSFFTISSQSIFSIQSGSGFRADYNWNALVAGAALTKWERSGSGYTSVAVPANLNDIFVKRTGSGAVHHLFLFRNGILVNAVIGGSSSVTVPSYIKAMPSLTVTMVAPANNFTINFSALADNQLEYVSASTGTDNGYMRAFDGKCGAWLKSSSSVSHTPGLSNGSAVGQSGGLSIVSYISPGVNNLTPSSLNYEITAGDPSLFAVVVESYRDLGIPGQFDASDILFDTRSIASTTAGVQRINLPDNNDAVILVCKSPAGCYDMVVAVINNRAPLPVKLESFNVALSGNDKTVLTWVTATEDQLSHFEVERSVDGIHFQQVSLVFAYGNSEVRKVYHVNDQIASLGATVIYYRLRSVDINGTFRFSEVKAVRLGKQSLNQELLVFPNPVIHDLRITLPATVQNKAVQIALFNQGGQLVMNKQISAASQTEILNTTSLSSGIYFLKVNGNGQVFQQRVVKY